MTSWLVEGFHIERLLGSFVPAGCAHQVMPFLYIFRHSADTTQQLTTQVLLRHCGKRGGKICPTTLDFANQDVQVLNDRHFYIGGTMDVRSRWLGAERKGRPLIN